MLRTYKNDEKGGCTSIFWYVIHKEHLKKSWLGKFTNIKNERRFVEER